MDELIRKALFKPYLKLNKQSSETQQDSWPECRSLLILHEGIPRRWPILKRRSEAVFPAPGVSWWIP